MDVQGEVVGEDFTLEDIPEVFTVARSEPNRVMGDFRICARRSKIENIEAHGFARAAL